MTKEELCRYMEQHPVPADELTPYERSELLSAGREIDRIPCCLDGGETMAPLLGYSIDEYYHSAEKMYEVEEYMYRTFGTDGVSLSTTLRGMAEAMGSKLRYFDRNVAQLDKPAFSLKESERAKIVDVDRDGRLPIILKGLQMLKKNLAGEVPVSATVTGPFTVAAMLVGTEELLTGMLKMPERVHALMRVIVENNNRYISRLIDLGVGIGFADPLSSTSVISVRSYREFSYPYFKQNVDFIKAHGRGCGLHICGKSKKLWPCLPKTGIGLFGLDNVEDLGEAVAELGGSIALQGNVPPVDVMFEQGPEAVILSAKECIRAGYRSPCGYTLTSGCQMPVGTPVENMHALMNAARVFGHYPIDEDLLNA